MLPKPMLVERQGIMRAKMVPDVAAVYVLKELAGDAGKAHGSIGLGPLLKGWGDPRWHPDFRQISKLIQISEEGGEDRREFFMQFL